MKRRYGLLVKIGMDIPSIISYKMASALNYRVKKYFICIRKIIGIAY